MSSPHVVPTRSVIPLADLSPTSRAVRTMMRVLARQGQIEPLQVHAVDDKFIVFHDDAWGSEIVYAARNLGWPTLLVVEMTKYEA